MEAYNNIRFQFVNICVDAQVVLNWLITKEPKVKSKFVRNRVFEVDGLACEFTRKFKLPIMYRYVKTDQNPADLVTRGVSYNKYLSTMSLWMKGPEWLSNDLDNWPKYPLMSVSPDHKMSMNSSCMMKTTKVNTGIVNIDRFSSMNKLLKCTS